VWEGCWVWVLGEGCWVLQMALGVGRGLVRALRFMTWGNRCGNPPPPPFSLPESRVRKLDTIHESPWPLQTRAAVFKWRPELMAVDGTEKSANSGP